VLLLQAHIKLLSSRVHQKQQLWPLRLLQMLP
jgi:hypothetical protein